MQQEQNRKCSSTKQTKLNKIDQKFHLLLLIKHGIQSIIEGYCFVQLDCNLSNGVTDTLESSSMLIYFQTGKSIDTQKSG